MSALRCALAAARRVAGFSGALPSKVTAIRFSSREFAFEFRSGKAVLPTSGGDPVVHSYYSGWPVGLL
jgi:hypothetical protein